MANVVVLGSLNLDLVAEVTVIPEPGETVMATGFRQGAGGKGANQAVAAARMGARVSMVGAVGRDEAGRKLTDGLIRDGIDVNGVRVDDGPTGTAMILVDANAENIIAVVPGANSTVGPRDANVAVELLQPGGVLLCQLEIPIETVEAAARQARDRHARVVLNAAPVRLDAIDLLRHVDVLVVNAAEAAVLIDSRVSSWPWAAKAAASLRELGPRAVVLTQGELGAVMADGNGGVDRVEPYRVDAVDTVGAGDAFLGALASQLACGTDLKTAARAASACGALTVQRRGAQEAMPTVSEVDQLLRSADGRGQGAGHAT